MARYLRLPKRVRRDAFAPAAAALPPPDEASGPSAGTVVAALLVGLALALAGFALKAVYDVQDARRELRVLLARVNDLQASDRRQQAEVRRLRQALQAAGSSSTPALAADGGLQWTMSNYRDVFNGVLDPILLLGYNAMPAESGTTRIDEARHAYTHTFEGDYFDGAEHLSEWNIQATTAAAITRRIFGQSFSWTTERARWQWAGELFTLGKDSTYDVHVKFDLGAAGDRAVHHRFAGGDGEQFQIGAEEPGDFPDFYIVGPRAYVDFALGFALYRDGQFALGADPSAAGGRGPMLVLGTPSQVPEHGPALYIDPTDGVLTFIDGNDVRHALH